MATLGADGLPIPPTSADYVPPVGQDIYAMSTGNAGVNERFSSLVQQYEGATVGATLAPVAGGELVDDQLELGQLTQLILAELNGSYDLPNQKVVVQYLTQAERMLIPQALGMTLAGPAVGRCARQNVLADRYWIVANHSYAELVTAVYNYRTLATLRAELLKRAPRASAGLTRYTAWDDPDWCNLALGVQGNMTSMTATFTQVSRAMQANCDIRDFGMLNEPGMWVNDNAWQTVDNDNITSARLRPRLHAYSIKCIAVLNYAAVGETFIAAMARAYGVACGILPSPTSRTMVEWTWTTSQPVQATMNLVNNAEMTAPYHIQSMALNVLAMFGVFHLNKDHTYRTNDPNMERIGTSYINTLRTMTTADVISNFIAQKLHVVRTGPHPFGLAQTYWLYRVMYRLDHLATPLAVRHDVRPPTLSRLEIVNAARKEWTNLPIGSLVNSMFETSIGRINAMRVTIGDNVPAYSNLHSLYGIDVQQVQSNDAVEAIAVLMPCVYGFSESQHSNDQTGKEGLALAQCFTNLLRDNKAAADMWVGLWQKYTDTAGTKNLSEFIAENMATFNAAAGGAPAQVVPA